MPHRHHRARVLAALAAATLPVLLLIGATSPPTAAADTAHNPEPGHVYVLNNNLAGTNSISSFTRRADGSLASSGTTPIGGLAA